MEELVRRDTTLDFFFELKPFSFLTEDGGEIGEGGNEASDPHLKRKIKETIKTLYKRDKSVNKCVPTT